MGPPLRNLCRRSGLAWGNSAQRANKHEKMNAHFLCCVEKFNDALTFSIDAWCNCNPKQGNEILSRSVHHRKAGGLHRCDEFLPAKKIGVNMAVRRTKATRGTAVHRKKHRTSKAPRRKTAVQHARAKKSLARSPRISRRKIGILGDDLETTGTAVAETFDNFWVIPEHHIRETLARAHQKIARAVDTLKKAA
jgi:hypothetical protein